RECITHQISTCLALGRSAVVLSLSKGSISATWASPRRNHCSGAPSGGGGSRRLVGRSTHALALMHRTRPPDKPPPKSHESHKSRETPDRPAGDRGSPVTCGGGGI